MKNPLEYDAKFDFLFQSEILNFLSLKEDIQPRARVVCKSWQKVCQAYKTAWVEALDAKSAVVLLELTSAKGKTLNGNTVNIIGDREENTHRYPILFDNWLTGESETLNIKICNLNPNATHRSNPEANRHDLVGYTSNSKLKRSHGMMLDQMLMLARWETNILNGMLLRGSYRDFTNLPRQHPVLARLNANMWTWWTVPPKLAGYRNGGTISDLVCSAVMKNDPSLTMAKEDKPWPQDGPDGAFLVRNMVRAMRTWADQRIYDTFWVSHKFKTGSILTSCRDGTFGQVYLVKGHNSVIAEMVEGLPFCCRATLLPIYDCWTYDGLITGISKRLSKGERKALEAHVKKSIIEKTVSWRGPIAENWSYPPPPFPTKKFESDEEVELDWSGHHDYRNPNINTGESEVITEEHLEIGRKIAETALSKGGISSDRSPQMAWVIRRFGYTYEENPNGLAMITRNGMPLGPVIIFQVDHKRGKDPSDNYIPTYNLKEALKGLLDVAKMLPVSHAVHADELAVVAPFEKVLNQCFEEAGATAPSMNWYPPASEEETFFAGSFGNG